MRFLSLYPIALACLLAYTAASAQTGASPAPAVALDPHALFTDKGCAHCHGPEAAGTDKAPDLRTLGHRMKVDEIRHQIVDGGKEMPAFGEALTPEETDALVAWVHSLKAPAKARKTTSARPPS